MQKLILIKHAAPVVSPGVPPEKWALSDAGRRQCDALATAVSSYSPSLVVTSVEPKAAETGQILAGRLGIGCETSAGLHEHDRSNVPHMPSRDFISLVELFFREPGKRVLGNESADEALGRFHRAMESVVQQHPAGDLAVVAHGTVIALLLEDLGAGKGFDLWRKMGLPSFAVLELPEWNVKTVVDRV